MLRETLIEIFERDLLKLKEEIQHYLNEYKIWVIEKGISNSGGNLCLHLIGNLNHFIGATLGNTGYIRNREDEFKLTNLRREELIKSINETKFIVRKTLTNLPEDDLEKNYPLDFHGKTVTTQFMMLHLISHFNYHLGQINYHRRLLDEGR